LTTTTAPPPLKRRRNRADILVRAIGILGRVFVLAGVLLLFFTAYLLWGTGVYTKNEQAKLEKELQQKTQVSEQDIADGKFPSARPEGTPALGSSLFSIKIPKIGLDTVVVEGVGVEELKKGPGLFPDCAVQKTEDCVDGAKYPGEEGNVAISGHRTTYGAPFFRLNDVQNGDTIDLESRGVRYRYKVTGQEIVDPVAGYENVLQHGKTELTLTTCHPRFSAAQRLIVHADYVGPTLARAASSSSGGSVKDQPVVPTDVIVLGAIAVAAALGSLALSRRYQRTAAYLTSGMVIAAGLWVFAFPRIVLLMPANY
jgi:sortase A